ncbi:6135_t:CDS:2, partial [Scutellospora calospora]
YGPSPEDETAASQFRKLWGKKAKVRRFKIFETRKEIQRVLGESERQEKLMKLQEQYEK